jgi:hypothetical protein
LSHARLSVLLRGSLFTRRLTLSTRCCPSRSAL